MKEFKITDGRKTILNALDGQPVRWAELRVAYFGVERAKSKANTAFAVQLKSLTKHDIITKEQLGREAWYSLSDNGKVVIAKFKDDGGDLAGTQSVAAAKFVAPEVTPVAEVTEEAVEEAAEEVTESPDVEEEPVAEEAEEGIQL